VSAGPSAPGRRTPEEDDPLLRWVRATAPAKLIVGLALGGWWGWFVLGQLRSLITEHGEPVIVQVRVFILVIFAAPCLAAAIAAIAGVHGLTASVDHPERLDTALGLELRFWQVAASGVVIAYVALCGGALGAGRGW
jgi:hypothetical protein